MTEHRHDWRIRAVNPETRQRQIECHSCTDRRTVPAYTLIIPGHLLTTNRANSLHWSARAAHTKQWRWDSAMIAREAKVPHFGRIRVTIEPHQLRGRLADTTGHNPSGKAALDGLVDAGVVDDDDSRHIDGPLWLPVVRSDRKYDYLRIEIEEVP